MHNLDIDKLLQQLITTTGIVDEDTNYLDHIDEHNFFALTDNNRLLVSIWYLITLLTDHSISTTSTTNDVNVSNLNDLVDNTFNTKVTNDVNINLNALKDLLLTVQLKDNEVKLADNIVKLNSLPEATLSTKTLTDLINILTTAVTSTKVTNIPDNIKVNNLAELSNLKVSNLNELITAILTTKLTDDNITAIATKLANTEFKLSNSTLTELINKLLSTVLTVKLDTKDITVTNLNTLTTLLLRTKLEDSSVSINNYNDLITTLLTKVLSVNVNNFNELITKLAATTLNTNTNFASLIASVLTVKLNNINELVSNTFNTKISNLDELATKLNIIKPKLVTEALTVSTDVSDYDSGTYQLVTSNIIGNFNISVSGSLDNTNWFPVNLISSNLTINNNVITINSNTTVIVYVYCNCRFIRLNINGLNLNSRIDSKLYLKP